MADLAICVEPGSFAKEREAVLNGTGKHAILKMMFDHEACVLRQGTGISGVMAAARLAAGRLADYLMPHHLEIWDGLKAEK